jgi:type IX secretion system PorP/SprF family membrane protein
MKIMKKQTLIIVLVLISILAKSQQLSIVDNRIRGLISSSAVGKQEQVVSWYEQSYSGYGNSQTSDFVLGFDKMYRHRLGTGAYLSSTNMGFVKEINFQPTVAVHIPVLENSSLSFGISPELQFITQNEMNPFRKDFNDPTITNMVKNQTNININMGVGFSSSNFYVDLGVQRIVSKAVSLDYRYDILPSYRLNAGGKFAVSPDVIISPKLSFQTILTPLLYVAEIGTDLSWRERFSFGYYFSAADFSDNYSFANEFRFGARTLDYFTVNFGYSIGSSYLYKYSQGTYQIYLTWDLKRSNKNMIKTETQTE